MLAKLAESPEKSVICRINRKANDHEELPEVSIHVHCGRALTGGICWRSSADDFQTRALMCSKAAGAS